MSSNPASGNLYDDLNLCVLCGKKPVKRMWLPEGCEDGTCGCVSGGCPLEGVDFTFDDWNKINHIKSQNVSDTGSKHQATPIRQPDQANPYTRGWNACLDQLAALRASMDEGSRGEPVAIFEIDATGYRARIVADPCKGLPENGAKLYAEPSHSGDASEMVAKVVLPERMYSDSLPSWAEEQKLVRGWNACLDEVAKLNGVKP